MGEEMTVGEEGVAVGAVDPATGGLYLVLYRCGL